MKLRRWVAIVVYVLLLSISVADLLVGEKIYSAAAAILLGFWILKFGKLLTSRTWILGLLGVPPVLIAAAVVTSTPFGGRVLYAWMAIGVVGVYWCLIFLDRGTTGDADST